MLTLLRLCLVLLAFGFLTTSASAQGQNAAVPALIKPADAFARMDAGQAREVEAYTLGVQAVIWSMQWVKGGQVMHSASAPLPQGTKPNAVDPTPHGINVWGHAQALLTPAVRFIETPNTETLYSSAILDLRDGPIVIVHPDLGDRYYRTCLWELHGDTHSISQKKDGGKPSPYVVVNRGWKGDLPKGVKTIWVHSRYVCVAPHIAVYGPKDLPNVIALQGGLKLIALKDWGKSNKVMERGQPMRPLRRPNTATPAELLFFEELCETLKDLTLRENELAFARQTERIGITLDKGFQFEKLDALTVAGLKRAVLDAQSVLEHKARALTQQQPGGTWMMSYDLANLDNWLFRAAVGWKLVWGDLSSEVLFPMLYVDASGQPLSGQRRYTLQFPAGRLPPARYWRISMYDLDGFFVDNQIRRYGIGNMAEKLEPNSDGSLTIYIQNQSPGKAKEVNWLPSPKEGFFLMLRIYQPEEKVYSGKYIVPPLREVK
jgi:hypothetical protein